MKATRIYIEREIVMKFLLMMNGWVEAPHCWMIYLTNPFQVDKVCSEGRYFHHIISIFGFVFFVKFG